MKILLQNHFDDAVGGVETYFSALKSALVNKGHNIIAVYTLSGKRSAINERKHKTYYIPGLDLTEDRYFLKGSKKEIKNSMGYLEEIVKEERTDIIHLNNTYYPSQYIFLKKYAPVIQTVHDYFNCCGVLLKLLPDAICEAPLGIGCFKNRCLSYKSISELLRFKTKLYNQAKMKMLSKILVTTQHMKKMLMTNGFREDYIEVLPLFVEDFNRDENYYEDVIIFVGRLAREKGVYDFIEMLRKIPSKCKAFIIGDGPLREQCESLVGLYGLAERVQFTGFLNREELREYFEKATVVVIPSLWPEPFCLVGIEAMIFHKPIVAYGVGGIPEWLKDNYNGYLVRRADIDGLVSKVNFLFNNKSLAKEIGDNGRRLYEKKFNKELHVRKLLNLYEELVLKKIRGKNYTIASNFSKNNLLLADKETDFNSLKRYLGEGWYSIEGAAGNYFVWSKKDAVLYFPSNKNGFRLHFSSRIIHKDSSPFKLSIFDLKGRLLYLEEIDSYLKIIPIPRNLKGIKISVSRTFMLDKLKPGSKNKGEGGICLRKVEEAKIYTEECAWNPRVMEIETTNKCNVDPPCVMCARTVRDKQAEIMMSDALYNNLKLCLEDAKMITLHGIGEPLIDGRVFDFLRIIDYTKTWTAFNTNGLLLDFENACKIILHQVKEINISCDAATEATYNKIRSQNFLKLKNNIKQLVQIKKERGLKYPIVTMSMVLMRENIQEVSSFVKLAAELGAEKVFFQLLSPVEFTYTIEKGGFCFDYKSQFLDIDEEFRRYISNAVKRSIQLGIEIDSSNKEILDVISEQIVMS